MKPISEAAFRQAQWVQPKISRNCYQLRAGEDLLAELEFPRWFSSQALASAIDGHWTFSQTGFFDSRVIVCSLRDETELAVFRPKWIRSEGSIQFIGGPSFIWKSANFWATKYVIQDSSGKPLILFRQGIEDVSLAALFKIQAAVDIQPAAQGLKELSLLVLLGWYLIIRQHQESAAAAAA